MLLYIVRHGDPDYDTDSLTPRGVLQAESVAKRLGGVGISQIFSSPMGRAKQTAEPLCRMLDLPCQIEPWTHEIEAEDLSSYSDLGFDCTEGSVYALNAHILGNGGYDLSYSHTFESPMFKGTQMDKVQEYLTEHGNAFLERLGYREENGAYRILRPNEDRVALFCHGDFSRTWLSILLRIPLHVMFSSFSFSHTGVTVLQFKNNENGWTAPRCLCLGDLSQMYAHGPDMNYNGEFPL